MEIKGTVVEVLPMQSGTSKTGNPWQKCSVVVETAENPQYPKKVVLDNMKAAQEFGKIPVGAIGRFQVEIESREWNGRWFTSVNCWKWELESAAAPQSVVQPTPIQEYCQPQAAAQAFVQESGGDLPF